MASTRVQLCGRQVAEVDGRRLEERLPGRQGRLLFAYLVVHRLREVSRDDLVAARWPEGTDAGLAPLLSKLRRLVPLSGRGEIRLALPPGAWVDLEATSEALHRAESALARGAAHAAYGPARVTQHIAMRGFLPWHERPWTVELQRRLERLHARALEVVTAACLEIGGPELHTAERAARRLVGIEPHGESGHRLLIRVLAAEKIGPARCGRTRRSAICCAKSSARLAQRRDPAASPRAAQVNQGEYARGRGAERPRGPADRGGAPGRPLTPPVHLSSVTARRPAPLRSRDRERATTVCLQ